MEKFIDYSTKHSRLSQKVNVREEVGAALFSLVAVVALVVLWASTL